jgi:hypothetical protein
MSNVVKYSRKTAAQLAKDLLCLVDALYSDGKDLNGKEPFYLTPEKIPNWPPSNEKDAFANSGEHFYFKHLNTHDATFFLKHSEPDLKRAKLTLQGIRDGTIHAGSDWLGTFLYDVGEALSSGCERIRDPQIKEAITGAIKKYDLAIEHATHNGMFVSGQPLKEKSKFPGRAD